MFFRQYYPDGLPHASYMIGNKESGLAAVIVPLRDSELYHADAWEYVLQIQDMILTRLRTGFFAGLTELRDQPGPSIYAGVSAEPEFDFVRLKGGNEVDLFQHHVELSWHPVALDIRSMQERKTGWIPDSVTIPLTELPKRCDAPGTAQSRTGRRQDGYRSSIVCSRFQKYEFVSIHDFAGRLDAWQMAKLPIDQRATVPS